MAILFCTSAQPDKQSGHPEPSGQDQSRPSCSQTVTLFSTTRPTCQNGLQEQTERMELIWFYRLLLEINAEVVTCVAGSLWTGGLPGYPKSKISVLKTWQSLGALRSTQIILKTRGLQLYTKCLHVKYCEREKWYICTGRRLASKS